LDKIDENEKVAKWQKHLVCLMNALAKWEKYKYNLWPDEDDLITVKIGIYLTWHQQNMISVFQMIL
jgi:hypothetical protein